MQAASLRLQSAAANIVKGEAASPAAANASQPVTPLLGYDPNAPYANLQSAVAQPNGVIDVFWKGSHDPHLWHAQYNPRHGWAGRARSAG